MVYINDIIFIVSYSSSLGTHKGFKAFVCGENVECKECSLQATIHAYRAGQGELGKIGRGNFFPETGERRIK
jgi:hypothetical protein